MNKKVLIIEDDPDIADLLKIHLKDLDLELDSATDGEHGLELALENSYQLVVLDLMLPKMNGMDVCKSIREQNKTLPILILSAKSEEFDKVLGLELGADDYMTKPFGIRELVARIKSILRRVQVLQSESSEKDSNTNIIIGDLAIYPEKRKVLLMDKKVELTAKEFDLLFLFASHPGKAYSRESLLNIVWGYQFSGYEHTVNSHINRLRAKIEAEPSQPRYIQTVWGVGYKFPDLEDIL